MVALLPANPEFLPPFFIDADETSGEPEAFADEESDFSRPSTDSPSPKKTYFRSKEREGHLVHSDLPSGAKLKSQNSWTDRHGVRQSNQTLPTRIAITQHRDEDNDSAFLLLSPHQRRRFSLRKTPGTMHDSEHQASDHYSPQHGRISGGPSRKSSNHTRTYASDRASMSSRSSENTGLTSSEFLRHTPYKAVNSPSSSSLFIHRPQDLSQKRIPAARHRRSYYQPAGTASGRLDFTVNKPTHSARSSSKGSQKKRTIHNCQSTYFPLRSGSSETLIQIGACIRRVASELRGCSNLSSSSNVLGDHFTVYKELESTKDNDPCKEKHLQKCYKVTTTSQEKLHVPYPISSLSELDCDQSLKEKLLHRFPENEYILFPTQGKLLPVALKGFDIMLSSRAGSGKTLNYIIPALQVTLRNRTIRPGGPYCVIVTPTRELREQVIDDFRDLQLNDLITVLSVETSTLHSIRKTLETCPYDVIVGCLGTLIHLCHPRPLARTSTPHLELDNVSLFVLEDADILLQSNHGSVEQEIVTLLRDFASAMRTPHQTIVVCSKANIRRQQAIRELLREAFIVEIDDRYDVTIVEAVDHVVKVIPTSMDKLRALKELLYRTFFLGASLIFCNTRETTKQVYKYLTRHRFANVKISDTQLPFTKREHLSRLHHNYGDKDNLILVVTDFCPDGFQNVHFRLIINFDPPQTWEDQTYIRRVSLCARNPQSRTEQFGFQGIVVTLCSEDERDVFGTRLIESFIACGLPHRIPASLKDIVNVRNPEMPLPQLSQAKPASFLT